MLFLINDYYKTLQELAVRAGMDLVSSESPGGTNPDASANLSSSIIGKHQGVWNRCHEMRELMNIDDAFFTKDLSLLPNNPRVVAAKLFELTELVYKARYQIVGSSLDQALRAYKDGMRWYESFFAYTNSCDGNTSLELFSQ